MEGAIGVDSIAFSFFTADFGYAQSEVFLQVNELVKEVLKMRVRLILPLTPLLRGKLENIQKRIWDYKNRFFEAKKIFKAQFTDGK
jgi:hypothetical protein